MSENDQTRYARAAHAMQSGVAMDLQNDPRQAEPKHVRVGINSAFVTQAGLAKLLMDKGLFTQDEYEAAMADAMEAEVARYEALLSHDLGTRVTLA